MNYCFGCMRKRDANETVCPVCGYRHEGETWPAFALRPGTLLHDGKYLIGKVLGQGGFGITYIGLDTALEMKVAVKEYYPMHQVNRSSVTNEVLWHSASDGGSSGRESFLKEARRMAKVNAIPGIVQVKDIFYQKNTAYIVMNFIEGETLKEKLMRDGVMTPEECIRTLTPVIEALEQAHQSGLIHRDISPDNIMIDRKGKLWVLDMGAAKDLESGSGPTQSSQAVTKRGFSPPEQSIGSGRGKIGPWTDVYAMCATIYYCLTGKLVPEAMERFLNDELSFSANIPASMVTTLRHGLALRAEERIQTMEQLLRELNGETAEKEQKEQAKQRPERIMETVYETVYQEREAAKVPAKDMKTHTMQGQESGKKSIMPKILTICMAVVVLIGIWFFSGRNNNGEDGTIVSTSTPTSLPSSTPTPTPTPTPMPTPILTPEISSTSADPGNSDDKASSFLSDIAYFNSYRLNRKKITDTDGMAILKEYKDQNPNVIGILYIPNVLDYQPILLHPSEDNYYLTHDINNVASVHGQIWTNACEGRNFDTFNTVVYGFNSSDLFGPLLSYTEKTFIKQHNQVAIWDSERLHIYSICAAVEYDDRYITYRYDDSSKSECEEYLLSLHNDADGTIWLNTYDIKTDDHIITLSTSYRHEQDPNQDKRFLLIAVETDN